MIGRIAQLSRGVLSSRVAPVVGGIVVAAVAWRVLRRRSDVYGPQWDISEEGARQLKREIVDLRAQIEGFDMAVFDNPEALAICQQLWADHIRISRTPTYQAAVAGEKSEFENYVKVDDPIDDQPWNPNASEAEQIDFIGDLRRRREKLWFAREFRMQQLADSPQLQQALKSLFPNRPNGEQRPALT